MCKLFECPRLIGEKTNLKIKIKNNMFQKCQVCKLLVHIISVNLDENPLQFMHADKREQCIGSVSVASIQFSEELAGK